MRTRKGCRTGKEAGPRGKEEENGMREAAAAAVVAGTVFPNPASEFFSRFARERRFCRHAWADRRITPVLYF